MPVLCNVRRHADLTRLPWSSRVATTVPSDRVPPGQYVTDDFPVLSAGPTPHTPLDEWTFSIDRRGRRAAPLDAGTSSARCRARQVTVDIHCVTKWSKLDTAWEGVSVDTLLDGVETTAEYVARVLRRRLHDEPAARGRDRRQGVGRLRATAASRSTRARRACAAARAAPLLLEEREVGARPDAARRGRARASGRATATTTTATRGGSSGTGATEAADVARRLGRRVRRRDAATRDARARRRRLGRRIAPAQHVDVRLTAEDGYQAERSYSIALGAATTAARAHRGADRRRRGVAVPRRRAAVTATRSRCAGRSAATSSGSRRTAGRLLLVGGGSGVVPLTVDAPRVAARRRRGASHLLREDARRRDLPRRAGGARRRPSCSR